MNKQAKHLYERMIDFKRFASIVLAAGVFFYLGTIIPSETKSTIDINSMIIASLTFLALSIFLFTRSKQYRQQLLEHEEGQEYLLKK